MKKIEKRAIMCLLLVFVLLAGLCVFIYRDWNDGAKWASYQGNRDVFADGDLAKGALYDRNGNLIMKNSPDGMEFNDDSSVRSALLHITGDRDNNIATGANRAFVDKLIGYDFINGVYSLNKQGEDVKLTLDAGVCSTAYQALGYNKGTVGVYNYKTGEIVCMVSTPTYDPAYPPSDVEEGTYLNRLIQGTFAPGSTFKLVTSAAALEKLSDAESFTWECTGSVDYGHDDYVTDIDVHGTVDMPEALEVSCNCYYGKLAEKVGPRTLKKYVSKAGLDESIKIDGMETKAGTFDYPKEGIDLAWTGIGQYHDMVNPCSMMVFCGAIANGGTAVMPKIIDSDGLFHDQISKLTTSAFATKDMIDESTAAKLKTMMHGNVENHYGGEGTFPGLNLCAKTGTAEVEGQDRPNSWFVGFVDDEAHPYAFVVLVESGGYGIDAAGSVANTVLQDLVNGY